MVGFLLCCCQSYFAAATEPKVHSFMGSILVVDDEPVNCRELVSRFAYQNYKVDTAYSIRNALEKIMGLSDYDPVITDFDAGKVLLRAVQPYKGKILGSGTACAEEKIVSNTYPGLFKW